MSVWKTRRAGMALALAGSLVATQAMADVEREVSRASGYETVVERKVEGELSPEGLRQASLLTAQIVAHLNAATENLADQDREGARQEIRKARTLAKVVRDMLPVTEVVTVVKDASGNEVYRDVRRVQDDLIPVFEGLVEMEVVQPIVDAKKEQAAVRGLELTDADLIYTSVLVDLSYVDRKLARAEQLLDDPVAALAQLVLAQTNGIHFRSDEIDDPLVEAQSALRLAERNLAEGRIEGARRNLARARLRLETYRGLVGEARGKEVAELERQLADLAAKIEEPGATERLRAYWHRVTGWLRRERGEAHTTTSGAEGTGAATAAPKGS